MNLPVFDKSNMHPFFARNQLIGRLFAFVILVTLPVIAPIAYAWEHRHDIINEMKLLARAAFGKWR